MKSRTMKRIWDRVFSGNLAPMNRIMNGKERYNGTY